MYFLQVAIYGTVYICKGFSFLSNNFNTDRRKLTDHINCVELNFTNDWIIHVPCRSCHLYGRELLPKVYVSCFYSNLKFLYSWFLIVFLHACVLFSFLFLFILYYWVYGNCHLKSVFLAFILTSFILYVHACVLLSFIFLFILYYWLCANAYIKFQYEVSMHHTINQQTPSIKPNQWRRIRVAWI